MPYVPPLHTHTPVASRFPWLPGITLPTTQRHYKLPAGETWITPSASYTCACTKMCSRHYMCVYMYMNVNCRMLGHYLGLGLKGCKLYWAEVVSMTTSGHCVSDLGWNELYIIIVVSLKETALHWALAGLSLAWHAHAHAPVTFNTLTLQQPLYNT